jgi:hypothetical protein
LKGITCIVLCKPGEEKEFKWLLLIIVII